MDVAVPLVERQLPEVPLSGNLVSQRRKKREWRRRRRNVRRHSFKLLLLSLPEVVDTTRVWLSRFLWVDIIIFTFITFSSCIPYTWERGSVKLDVRLCHGVRSFLVSSFLSPFICFVLPPFTYFLPELEYRRYVAKCIFNT